MLALISWDLNAFQTVGGRDDAEEYDATSGIGKEGSREGIEFERERMKGMDMDAVTGG